MQGRGTAPRDLRTVGAPGMSAGRERRHPVDFAYSDKVKGLRGASCRRSWTRTSTPTSASTTSRSQADRWQQPADHGGAEGEGARRGALEPVPARERARRRADEPRIRAALRDHGPRRLSRPRSSTARRPTPATWRCSSATARRAEGALARAAARRRDPLRLRDDRARGRLVRRHQHPVRASCATATTTSSTAASGGPRAPAIRAARSSSSWARRDPTAPTGTSSSR